MKEGSPEPPARQGGEVADDGVPEPIGIDDDDPVVDAELPGDYDEVEVGDSWLPAVEDYLPQGEQRDGETEEPENNDPRGAGGIGDVPMDVDAAVLRFLGSCAFRAC